jgi:hypothetical protein
MPEVRNLSARATQLLTASAEERIEHIKKKIFIPYGAAKEILSEMNDLLNHPKVNRMPNMLIAARSNNGKSELLKAFLRENPAEERIDQDAAYAPVVYIQCPPGPSEHLFLNKILTTLGVAVRQNEAADGKIARLLEVLSKVQTKVFLIDELNALLAGSVTKQRYFLNMLKYISNDLQISIVAAGTADALQAIKTDAQIESRFPVRILPLWQDNENFRRLLTSFESVIPLRDSSHLDSPALAKKLYGLSEGTIGELALILRSAAEYAISSGTEKITLETLASCQYVKRHANSNIGKI